MAEKILALLQKLDIQYEKIDHVPIMTMDEGKNIAECLQVKPCKNLFLEDKQGQHYLLLLSGEKKFRAKDVSQKIGCSHLSFGSPENLHMLLGTTPGAVSALGLLNDTLHKIHLLIDTDVLKEEYIGCHPCVNTMSIKIRTKDLTDIFLPYIGIESFSSLDL